MSRGYVYRLCDGEDRPLYIGSTVNPRQRPWEHLSKPWADEIASVTITVHESPGVAADVERREIQEHTPEHNIVVPNSLVSDPEWLQARIDEGLTNQEIAKLAGVSKPRLAEALKAYGTTRYLRPALAHPLLSDKGWLEVAIEDGPTLQELAGRAGAAERTVRTWLDFHGLHDARMAARRERLARERGERGPRYIGRPPKYPQLRDLEWLHAAVAERGCMQVSREIGCHVSSVMRALERNSYTIPHPVAVGARSSDGPRKEVAA